MPVSVQSAVKALGVAASRLLTGVASMVSQEGPTPQLAVLAEQVRTKAEGVEKVPLDQRSALCKAFAAAGISVQARAYLLHASACSLDIVSDPIRVTL